MSDFEQLKPCPFCGGHPNEGSVGSSVPGMEDDGYLYIECPHCNGASGKPFIGVHGDDKEVLRGIWNTRSAIASMQGDAVEITKDSKLPFAIRIGNGTIGKGCKFSTLLLRINAHNEWFAQQGFHLIPEKDAEIARLTKELEEARKDAERWEAICNLWFLCSELKLIQNEDGGYSICEMEFVDNLLVSDFCGDTPEQAIDAAISKIGGGE